MFRLDGKFTLVTGAASGIGAAIAENFGRAGAFVWVTDRDASGAEATAQRIEAAGGKAAFRKLDIAQENEVEQVRAEVLAGSGRLDVLVNNAGIGCVGTLAQTSGADLDRLWAVNVRGTFNMCRAFLPSMLERRAGNIINLASIGGVVAVRDRFAYCTTKFAIVGLTKCIALDHAREGIRCNCLCPGRVETPWVAARLREYPDPAAARREMESTQAIGRMATPAEIASAALYLAGDESAFVTGTDFIIDGGWTTGK
jgi:NAD(P)-dependent dehydrogenase (short-subunit alcohol dehydrogenase family)